MNWKFWEKKKVEETVDYSPSPGTRFVNTNFEEHTKALFFLIGHEVKLIHSRINLAHDPKVIFRDRQVVTYVSEAFQKIDAAIAEPHRRLLLMYFTKDSLDNLIQETLVAQLVQRGIDINAAVIEGDNNEESKDL
jgi:hypothetical protein